MKRVISVIASAVVLLSLLSFTASADSFTREYKEDGSYRSVPSRQAYAVRKVITASGLGLSESFEGITDVTSGPDGKVYLLCGETSKLFILNSDYTFLREAVIEDKNGVVSFSGAQGIFVDKNGRVYIADTENGRIIIANQKDKVEKIWEAPVSDILPEDFRYKPTSIVSDADGFTFVLSFGCYYGALVFSPEGNFTGFYGSNTVQTSALDTLSYLWDMMTKNDTKRAASLKKLPYSFVDFSIDPEGYLVTCTGKTQYTNGTGQIQKISGNGANILYKRDLRSGSVSSSAVNFLEQTVIRRKNIGRTQSFNSVETDSDGFIYALDRTYGLIYVYDSECNLLNGFGGGVGTGDRAGTFNTAVALALCRDDILVADYENRSITVFGLTDYGKLLRSAQTMYIKGDYNEAKPLWEKVLSFDRGNQLAYSGLAMASYNEGNYEAALEYAESGLDYSVYDLSRQALFSAFFAKNFLWIVFVAVIVIAGIAVLFVMKKKRGLVFIDNPKATTMLSVPFHPFRSFEEIKYKKRGSMPAAFILTALLFAAFTLKSKASGFLFTYSSPKDYDLFFTLLQTVGIIVLWSVSNWLICSLFSGKGKLSEVFIVTVYSLIPLVVYTFLRVVLSRFLPLSGVAFMNGLEDAIVIFTFFLICIAIMAVHEYDFFKFLITAVVTLLFMVLIVFVLFLISVLLKELFGFIGSVYNEIAYR